MSEPMTPERITELRQRHQRSLDTAGDDPYVAEVVPTLFAVLDEVQRLRWWIHSVETEMRVELSRLEAEKEHPPRASLMRYRHRLRRALAGEAAPQ